MKKSVGILPYIFLFIIVLLWNLIIFPSNLNEIWNYGFAHNIFTGLVPYRDFNMIGTPLYSILMSVPFHIFDSNILVFHITHTIVLVSIFYMIFKLFSRQGWLIVLLFFLPFPSLLPNSNWLSLLLFVIILRLESLIVKNDENDILIGFLLGLSILTNLSLGLVLLLPSILYILHPKKIIMRLIGLIIPMVAFFVYLSTTGATSAFYELSLNKIFDFSNIFSVFTLLMIAIVLLTLRLIRNDFSDIKNYYGLAFYVIFLQAIDYQHFQLCFIAFAIVLFFSFTTESKTFRYGFCASAFIVAITLLGVFMFIPKTTMTYPNNINRFEYRLIPKETIYQTQILNKFLEKHERDDIVFINSNAYYFKIINNLKIGHLDILNKDYWGKNGNEKILNRIKVRKNAFFIIDKDEMDSNKEIDKEIIDYIIKNGTRVERVGIFDIYIIN